MDAGWGWKSSRLTGGRVYCFTAPAVRPAT
jgi:hypothetical protein